jgi:hypothetical protein
MNRINTNYNGGFPLNLNDLRFTDDAVRLAFKDILRGFAGNTPVVIFGCEATPIEPEGHTISEGAIFYQGEIWHVDEHTIGEYGDAPDWAFYLTYDETGNKIFKDGIQHNTYELRKAKQYGLNGQPAGTIYTTSANNVKLIKDIFLGNAWANPTLGANTTIISGSALLLGKTINRVTLQGQIRNSYISGNALALTLPVGFRPATALSGYIPGKITGQTDFIMLRYALNTAGEFWLYYDSTVSCDIDLLVTFLTA